MLSAVNSNNKSAIKFEKKAIRKTDICIKQAQKTSKFQLKQAQKQATRKSSKKPATPQKNKPKFCGKTARLATLLQKLFRKTVSSDSDVTTRNCYQCGHSLIQFIL